MRFVVIDTNCLIRMIPLHSKYRPLWESFLDGKYILCISNEIVSEYMEILSVKVSSTFASNIVVPFFGVLLYANSTHNSVLILLRQILMTINLSTVPLSPMLTIIVSEDSHFDVLRRISFPKVNLLTLDQFMGDIIQTDGQPS